jgi:tetratricopeptide (TPR) repeat protein
VNPYTRAVNNALGKVLELRDICERQRQIASTDVDSLLELPTAKRLRRVYHYRQTRLLTRAVIEELCTRSLRTGRSNPQQAAELCALANDICLAIEARNPPPHWSPALVADLTALVQAHAGNAKRLLEHWEQARRHFAVAHDRLGKGTGDGELRAKVFGLHASLLRERREFGEALGLLSLAQNIYRELHHDHEQGRVLMLRVMILRELNLLDDAVSCHMNACGLLDEGRDPWMVGAAWINLAVLFHDLGRYQDAWSTLQGMPDLATLCGADASILMNQLWAEGMVLRGLDHYEEAFQRLQFVREHFASKGCPATAALVMLDIAVLFSQQGRTADLRKALDEACCLYPPDAWQDDARGALERFRQAVEAGEAAAVLLTALRHIRDMRIPPVTSAD